MKRPWHVWIAFAACLAVVLAAMAWISMTALRLDRAETAARRQAALEENVQLALWRIDSELAPLVARESARPYFAYRTFLPVDRAYGRMFNRREGGEILIPSPLLGEGEPRVLVYFQFEPDGQLTSPQVPTPDNHDLAVPDHITEKAVITARARLDRLGTLVARRRLLTMLPEKVAQPVEVVVSPSAQAPQQQLAQGQQRSGGKGRGRGAAEFARRSQAVAQSVNTMVQNQAEQRILPGRRSLPSTDTAGTLMSPLWLDGELLLARRVAVDGRQYVQGCLLDWPGLKTRLLKEVHDLLPFADLEPVASPPPKDKARMLAALPVRLVPGGLATDVDGSSGPIRISLSVAWGCVLLAAIAVAVLLLGVVRLSERRAAFVSAVTHELRTPLTTFQMYAEMLAEDMVTEPGQRRDYLNTLRAEAARLTHLVENVLSYARLERGRGDGRMEDVTLFRLVEGVERRLADRAAGVGMELVVELPEAVLSAVVRANPSAVEQILFNLVDNACKYAAAAGDKRIHLAAGRGGGMIEVRISDHGPGVSPGDCRGLFRSFSKSSQDAANSAPGVGLGLALSRRLAGAMGGDLFLDPGPTDGACFVLTLKPV